MFYNDDLKKKKDVPFYFRERLRMKVKNLTRLEELKNDINKLMPQLKAKYESVKEKELFEVYRGRKAYKAVINEILKEKPKYWKGFGNFQVQAAFPIEYQKWFRNVPFRLFSFIPLFCLTLWLLIS